MPAIFPPNVSLHALNSSALNVSWEPIEEHLQQGLFLGYVVFFNDSSDELRNLTIPPGAMHITLTNLTGFTFYDVTVAGYTRKGLGPRSPRIGETTQEEGIRVHEKRETFSSHLCLFFCLLAESSEDDSEIELKHCKPSRNGIALSCRENISCT